MLSTQRVRPIMPGSQFIVDSTGRVVGVQDPTGKRDFLWLDQGDVVTQIGTKRYVDFRTAANGGKGSDNNDGLSWATAKATMLATINACSDYDTISFAGKCTESGVTSLPAGATTHLKGITIQGAGPQMGSQHIWKPAASAIGITVQGKGWIFMNFKGEPAPATALILAKSTATTDGSDLWLVGLEQNAGGMLFDADGVQNVKILGVVGHDADTAVIRAIKATIKPCLRWEILGFRGVNNANHIQAQLGDSYVGGKSLFQAQGQSITATTKLDLSGGVYGRNIVTDIVATGTYSIAGGYKAGANDTWYDLNISSGKTSSVPV